MSGVGVIDIYDTIKSSNGEHCRICFRTASVRKLVEPVFLRQFQDAMIIGDSLKVAKLTDLKVCYMCEALAAKAVRFLWAVQLAAIIEKLCSHMEIASRREVVLGHLNRTSESPSSAYCLQAEAIENSLYRLPAALTRTDTLIVGSAVASYSVQAAQVSAASDPAPLTHTQNPQIDNISNAPKPVQTYPGKRIPIPTLTTNTLVLKPAPIPRIKLTHTHTKLTQTDEQLMRNALFNYIPPANPQLIETQQSKRIPTHARNDAYLPQAALRVLQSLGDVVVLTDNFTSSCRALALRTRTQDSKGKDEFALHFIVFFAGNTYVPFIKLKISTDGMVKSVSDQDLYTFVNPPPPEKRRKRRCQSQVATTAIPGNTIPASCREATILKAMWDEDSVESKKQRVECPVILNPILDSYGVLHLGEPNAMEILAVNEPTVNVNINDEPCVSDATESSDRMVTNKQPIPSTHRVDWEDKIPMDVISFMDATDPNPSERIMQPNPPRPSMGVISDVRTVIDSDVQIIESVECIDLC